MYKFVADMKAIRHVEVKALVDCDGYSGNDLYYSYRSLNLFKGNETDVAATMGMMIFADAAMKQVPVGLIAPYVSEVIVSGVTYLAMQEKSWQLSGSPDVEETCRRYISSDQEAVRKRRLQELLGISERRSSRFLIVDRKYKVTVANDIDHEIGDGDRRFSNIFDAFYYANEIQKRMSGAVFVISAKEEV